MEMKSTLAGLASLLLLALLLLAGPALAVEKLYFADIGNEKIHRCDLNGTNVETLVTTDISAVGTIAIDRTAGKMYWTDWPSATGHIQRANLDGSDIETLLSGLSGPWGLALDVPGGKMYWTEFAINKIRRANLDGTGVEDLVTVGLSHPNGIALDTGSGLMYWGDGASEFTGKIMSANMDGTNVQVLLTDPVIAPQGIALDYVGGKIYWADLGTDSWYRCNFDGSNPEEILLSLYGTPTSVVLDLHAGKMYVAEYGGSNSVIKRANLDGSLVQVLISSGFGAIYGLTMGPAAAECSNVSMQDVWMAIVTGMEVYDYAVWLDFDGLGTITEMGAFNVPYPAGTYAIEPDCDMTGTVWTDGYVPFTGHVYSDIFAQIDIGTGPFDVLKVTDAGALEGCWAGAFAQDSTGIYWDVSLNIDGSGNIVSSTGFPGVVSGRIYTESGYLAGLISMLAPIMPWYQIMFQDVSTDVATFMTGTFGMQCGDDFCSDGVFYLGRCEVTGVGEEPSLQSTAIVQNYPNPFNPRTTIAFDMSRENTASLSVYDVTGRLVRTLLDRASVPRGRNEVVWDGCDMQGRPVSSGAYFYHLTTERSAETGRMMLVR
jgi:sugar lactone lactonase YvrE